METCLDTIFCWTTVLTKIIVFTGIRLGAKAFARIQAQTDATSHDCEVIGEFHFMFESEYKRNILGHN